MVLVSFLNAKNSERRRIVKFDVCLNRHTKLPVQFENLMIWWL